MSDIKTHTRFPFGVERKYVDDFQAAIIRAGNVDAKSIDVWADIISSTARTWDTTQPYHIVADLRKTGIPGKLIERFEEKSFDAWVTLMKKPPVAYAFVLPTGMINSISAMFLKRRLRNKFADWHIETFFEESSAIEWLRELRQ